MPIQFLGFRLFGKPASTPSSSNPVVPAAPQAPDSFTVSAPRAPAVVAPPAAVAAVRQMRELISSNRLAAHYEAAIGKEETPLKTEAMALFKALPKLNDKTTVEDMVAFGFWTKAPQGIEALQTSARYLPGRQIMVETTVDADASNEQTFLSYKEGGRKARTYRATLVGESGNNFLVKVDGRDEPLEFPKEHVYRLNQPHVFQGDSFSIGPKVDANSPFLKAKWAEAAIRMDALVGQIDFTRNKAAPSNFWHASNASTGTCELQRKCVRVVHDVIDMKYPSGSVYQEPGRTSGGDAGRQAVRGIGVCYEQAAVMAAMLYPFRSLLGVDVQFISGSGYRHLTGPGKDPFNGPGHGWLQLTYRPSMEMRICDRTWMQPDHPADRAYSRWGDRYPGGHYWGLSQQNTTDTDVRMSGNLSVATFERQFGEQGRDGRDNHMSLHQ